MAAGSGNTPNELSWGEVVTTCGIVVTFLWSSGDGEHCYDWLTEPWATVCWPIKSSVQIFYFLVSEQKNKKEKEKEK